jgi:hypothetical protein
VSTRRLALMSVALFVPAALSGCFETTYETGTAEPMDFHFPPPQPIEGVPEGVNDFLDPDDVRLMENVGLEVYRGDDPPDISGTWYLDSLVITWDDYSSSVGTPISETWITFTVAGADGSLESTMLDASTEGEGTGGYVSGSDGCFTAWIDLQGYRSIDDCTFSMPQVFSGCVQDGALADFQFGLIMAEREGDCSETVQVDHRRVMDEADGLAERWVEEVL